MTTLTSLRSHLTRVERLIPLPTEPVNWYFLVEDGEDWPDAWKHKVQPVDHVTVRYLVRGYLPVDDGASCGWYRAVSGGNVIVIYPDGTSEEIKRERAYRSRL